MFNRLTERMVRAGVLLGLATVAACGGSGGGDPPVTAPPVSGPPAAPPAPSPPARSDVLATAWYGAIGADDVNLRAEGAEITVWITEDDRFRFLWLDYETWEYGDALFTGTLTRSDEGFSGSGLAYAESGTTWADGSVVTPVVVSAEITVYDGQWLYLTGTWSTAAGDHGRFEVADGGQDCGGGSIESYAGPWSGYDTGPRPGLSLEFAADGSFSGADAEGCSFTGYLTPQAACFGLQDMTLTVRDCEITGDYTGLALREGWYEAFFFSVDDGSHSLTYVMYR